MRQQIKDMLASKGISFEKIANLFENTYSDCVIKTLNQEDMITGRGARGLSSQGKAYIDIKKCVDTFINNFNTAITHNIDEMNSSAKDLDIKNIDNTGLGTGENDENFDELYKSGIVISHEGGGADYYAPIAERIIEQQKAKYIQAVKTLCAANGITISDDIINNAFESAKTKAVSSAVSGQGYSNVSFSAGISGAFDVIPGTGLIKGAIESGWGGVKRNLGLSITPGGMVTGFISSFVGSSHHSSSMLDTKKLVDTFAAEFKQIIDKVLASA